MAALAADRQDKFWEFEEERKSPVGAARIKQDYEEALSLGVRGTPTIFINGRKLKNRSMENMEAIINQELEAAKGKKE